MRGVLGTEVPSVCQCAASRARASDLQPLPLRMRMRNGDCGPEGRPGQAGWSLVPRSGVSALTWESQKAAERF